MTLQRSPRHARATTAAFLTVACAMALGACTTAEETVSAKSSTKEYFAESEYGVKASPRVSELRSNLPRGGGRDQVGKPYKIKGKWYYPQEDPDYHKTGAASWYGDAFHGRLTANGEIYDMTHLTAAHPTMPLPSYARVTNTDNGSSVIVRVNDRGPYAHGRIIDLSRRAAELLEYTHLGIAKVEVEYLGRAPLHGQDDAFLMASYRPGGVGPDPSDGLPSGVMMAMNGATPPAVAPPFPGLPQTTAEGDPALPAFGPIAPERPGTGLARHSVPATAALAYASTPGHGGIGALSRLAAEREESRPGTYIALGTFAERSSAQAIASRLDSYGRVVLHADGGSIEARLYTAAGAAADDALRAAWAAGVRDAMTVRDR
jgi:rare lipoprotein A